VVQTSAVTGIGLTELRAALLDLAPPDFIDSPPLPATWSALES